MTTELEQEFYKTFEIEPECHNPIVKLSKDKKCEGICKNCEQYNYPEITAEKLLEMICICSSYLQSLDYDICPNLYEIGAKNMNDLKEEILEDCILYSSKEKIIKEQVKALFESEDK